MQDTGTILVINPGSTSTKLAAYRFDLPTASLTLIAESQVAFPDAEATTVLAIKDELDQRYAQLLEFLATHGLSPSLIMARGAPLAPLEGGTYSVNQAMLADLESAKYSQHASNLAALMGARLGKTRDLPVFIADPITTDEFHAVARISGVPEIQRLSRSHALNIKASTRRVCEESAKDFAASRWVVCHMGGGISVAAVDGGRIIDVNDALLGMGPFSAERAGALPLAGLLALAFSGDYTRSQLEQKLSRASGLKGYLGSADLQEIENRIQSRDSQAQLIHAAMTYQIAKEIAAMASVLDFALDGIILTGGMAHSQLLVGTLKRKLGRIAPFYVQAGENEGLALAEAGLRILLNQETPKIYPNSKSRPA